MCVYKVFTYLIFIILTACFYSPSLEAGMPGGLILVNMTSSNGDVHTRGKMNVKTGEDQVAFHTPILQH